MRIALADAGDAMDDANFEQTSANAAILRLTKELTWIEEISSLKADLRSGPPTTFFDKVFENAMNIAVHRTWDAYQKMLFRDALKFGFFDLMSARDTYRFSSKATPLNGSLIERYLEISTRLMVPVAPHTMDHVWVNLLKKEGTALTAGWPEVPKPEYGLQQAAAFVEDFIANQRRNKTKLEAPLKGKKATGSTPRTPLTTAKIVTSEKYLPWQEVVLTVLAENYSEASGEFSGETISQVVSKIQAAPSGAGKDEKQIKRIALPFTKFKMDQAMKGAGMAALTLTPTFDEASLLEELREYVQDALGLTSLQIERAVDGVTLGIYPGNPDVTFS